MTPQELKNSILQLAIQGKLVEQRPGEGTAEELYRQIQAEKQKLIKAGKLKKEKPLPEITEDEKPFDIPESWKWVRVSELGKVIGGGTPKTENADYWNDKGIPWLTPADMKYISGKYAKRGERNISADGLEKSSAQLMPKGTILYSSRAPIGYIAIAANDISTNQGFKSLVPAVIEINDFMYYCLMARTGDIVSRASGTTFKEISGSDFGLTIVTLPPLAEQKRIVAKIEELLPYIDRYEQAWSKLEEFNKRFPTDMQKSILQMAIEGKLVEQCLEEGTGEELYQQIQAEKQRLIKAGKLKKEKPLPEITEEEKPFDIPDSWKWVRLRDLTENIGDGIHGTPDFNSEGDYYFINGNNLENGKVVIKATTQRVGIGEYEKYRKPLTPTTVLISINGTIGNIAYYNDEPVILGKSACYIALIKLMHKEYIQILLRSQFFLDYAVSKATQTTIKNVSLNAIRMIPVPLPPLAEQKRIVAKLEEILPLCEKLK